MVTNKTIELEDLDLEVPTYEDWLKEGGEKKKADELIAKYAQTLL